MEQDLQEQWTATSGYLIETRSAKTKICIRGKQFLVTILTSGSKAKEIVESVFSKFFWEMLRWRRVMDKHSDWFDKNEPAQDRFEENEEWLEELEERVDQVRETTLTHAKNYMSLKAYPTIN